MLTYCEIRLRKVINMTFRSDVSVAQISKCNVKNISSLTVSELFRLKGSGLSWILCINEVAAVFRHLTTADFTGQRVVTLNGLTFFLFVSTLWLPGGAGYTLRNLWDVSRSTKQKKGGEKKKKQLKVAFTLNGKLANSCPAWFPR